MRPLALLLAPLAVTALAAGSALADVTIEMKINGEPHVMCVAPHAFQTTMKDGMMIFRGDSKLLWTVDVKDKTYTEVTEEDAKAMGAKMNDAMAKMQEALKNAPPAQRAMMEKMMKGQMSAMSPKERVVTPMGQTKTVNGFACTGYTVAAAGDEESNEVWSTDPKAAKIDQKDMAVWKEFAEFMKAMLPGMDQFADLIKDYDNPAKGQVPGLPILTIHKDKSGKEKWRSEIVKIDHGSIPADKFEVPAGFKKEKAKLDE